MRSVWAGLLFLTAAAAAQAQSLEQKLEEKMKEPFLKKAPWFTDYDKAREEAKKTNKPIFAYFTRSYSP